MPISQRVKKLIRSLQQKKFRKEERSFLVEGEKSVVELLHSEFQVTLLAATPSFIEQHTGQLRGVETVPASETELASAGSFQTNQSAIAVVKMRPNEPPHLTENEFTLVLDDVRDPGNLGTMIRTADWYGLRHIIASDETADFYNPKTISASMGSFLRVSVFYTDLQKYLQSASNVYGAFLDGEDVHTKQFGKGGFVVIGNESNGISDEVAKLVQHRIMIPRYGKAESLNAGVATAIILDNIMRTPHPRPLSKGEGRGT